MPKYDIISQDKTVNGDIFYFGFDGPIGDSIRLYGQWARSEIEFLEQFIAEGDTVVDGGANIGTHTLGFAQACGQDGRVIAVEASPEIAALLTKSIIINNLPQVEVLNAALGEEEGTCTVPRLDPGRRQNTGVLQALPSDTQQREGLQVKQIPLDSLELSQLALLKLDIEGGELAALKGAARTIEAHRPVISVEVLRLSSALPIVELLQPVGYKTFFCSFAAFDPENHKGETENIFGVAREAILLFSPDISLIPIAPRGGYVASVNDADDLARLITEMPRYGDRTGHDRVLDLVISERNTFEDMVNSMTSAAQSEDKVLSEIRHLWHYLEESKALSSGVIERVYEVERTLELQSEKNTKLFEQIAKLTEQDLSLEATLDAIRATAFSEKTSVLDETSSVCTEIEKNSTKNLLG